jgi:GDP-L-fucose synthase
VGSSAEISIKEIAELIRNVVGYEGRLQFDTAKPDGMPLKALDSSELIAMGWRPKVTLRAGLEETYRWFMDTE